MSNKDSWPECVGMSTNEAETLIKAEKPGVEAIPVPEGSMVTMDYREDRVRIYHDEAGKVTQAPRIG